MSVPPWQLAAITLFVADPDRSKAFYERAFELSAVYEDADCVMFAFGETIVNLLVRSAAHGLIAPAVVADGDQGSSLQLSLFVDDTDAACAGLAARGVELLNGPMDRPWGKRTAAFADPDGHVWEVAQGMPDGS